MVTAHAISVVLRGRALALSPPLNFGIAVSESLGYEMPSTSGIG